MSFLYLYNEKTFEFMQTMEITLDGFGKEWQWANQTKLEPPEFGANEIPVFDKQKQAWNITSDFRGREGYIGEKWLKIKEIGALPSGFSDAAVKPPLTFEETKSEKREAINTERDRLEQAGFVYDGSPFDTNQISYMRLLGASQTAQTALAMGQGFNIEWTLSDNTIRMMSAEDMIGIIPAFAMYSGALHAKASALKALVDAVLIAEGDAPLAEREALAVAELEAIEISFD